MDALGDPAFSGSNGVPVDRCERRPVRMPGYALRGDGTTHQIYVLDLSYEGCGIETSVPLEAAEEIKLSVLQRGAIDAVVRWCRDGKAGLAFAPVVEKHYSPRRSERVDLTADVTLRRVGRSSFAVNVTNASPEGCRIQLVERPSEGERVLIRFEGLEALEAEVCWVEGFTAGVKFERPMHPAVFELLIERLSH
jgi:hypothetical protein